MSMTLWDLGSLLAVISIFLLSSSIVLPRAASSMISRRRLELAAKIAGLSFLAVALYLMWESLA